MDRVLSEDSELHEVARVICQRVSQTLALYEEGREAGTLDCLIFEVERLQRFLLSSISDQNAEVLESIAVG